MGALQAVAARWPETAAWCGPPVETARAWNAGLGRLALVHWRQAGEAALWWQGRSFRYRASAGTLDLLPAGTCFDDSSLDGLDRCVDLVSLDAARLALIGADGLGLKPALQLRDPALAQAVAVYLGHWHADPPLALAQGTGVAEALLVQLADRLGAAWPTGGAAGMTGPQRELVWQWVASRLGGDVRPAELLRRLPYNRQALAVALRASFGTTLRQFVLDRRIETARFLLLRTELSLTRIAMAVGFASPSHFATAFGMRVGCTPSAYRVSALPGGAVASMVASVVAPMIAPMKKPAEAGLAAMGTGPRACEMDQAWARPLLRPALPWP